MSLEVTIIVVVMGNLFCAVMGFVAGRAFGQISIDLEDAQQKAEKAQAVLDAASQKAKMEREAVENAASSDSPEEGLAAIFNEERGSAS